MTPVQRRIEPRSADDSLSGVVRCLYFADTFLRDGESPLHVPSCSHGVGREREGGILTLLLLLLPSRSRPPRPHDVGRDQLGLGVRLRPGGAVAGEVFGAGGGGGAGQGDPADAPGTRGGHRRAGRPGEPPARALRGVTGPGQGPRHAGQPLHAHLLGGAVQGEPGGCAPTPPHPVSPLGVPIQAGAWKSDQGGGDRRVGVVFGVSLPFGEGFGAAGGRSTTSCTPGGFSSLRHPPPLALPRSSRCPK